MSARAQRIFTHFMVLMIGSIFGWVGAFTFVFNKQVVECPALVFTDPLHTPLYSDVILALIVGIMWIMPYWLLTKFVQEEV